MATWKGTEIKYASNDGYFSTNKSQTWEYQTTSDYLKIIIKTEAYTGFKEVPETENIYVFDYDESRVLVKNILEWANRYLGEEFIYKILKDLKMKDEV